MEMMKKLSEVLEVLWSVTGGPDSALTCPVSAEEAGYAVTITH